MASSTSSSFILNEARQFIRRMITIKAAAKIQNFFHLRQPGDRTMLVFSSWISIVYGVSSIISHLAKIRKQGNDGITRPIFNSSATAMQSQEKTCASRQSTCPAASLALLTS